LKHQAEGSSKAKDGRRHIVFPRDPQMFKNRGGISSSKMVELPNTGPRISSGSSEDGGAILLSSSSRSNLQIWKAKPSVGGVARSDGDDFDIEC
jgi:hypothetical protein